MKHVLVGLILLASSVAGYETPGYRFLGPVPGAEKWFLSRHTTQDGVCAVSIVYNIKEHSPLHSNTLTIMVIDKRWHLILGKRDFSDWESPMHTFTIRMITVNSKTWALKMKVMASGLWAPINKEFLAALFISEALSPEIVIRAGDKLLGHYSIKGISAAVESAGICSISGEAKHPIEKL